MLNLKGWSKNMNEPVSAAKIGYYYIGQGAKN